VDKNILKTYAPKAREDFINAVTNQAAFYGIAEKVIESCEIKGDFAFITGRSFPKQIKITRDELVAKITSNGFGQVMEEAAYTWFNRMAAIRYMEINGYLSHGYRVLSHPEGHKEPEILEKAHFLEKLDGLEKTEILRLKMAGNKDNVLYRKLFIAQCNELSRAMPFLFERVDDPTELLLPDNLLNTDSIIRKMIDEIPEDDWKEVEIIGWLYQFYIADKKAALMKAKKAYRTEDIPAVTQLFTPNWIVKYLVQNSLGAKWLCTYPSSSLLSKMDYYIPPCEQTEDTKARLKEFTPASINPEDLTFLDIATGSGHILVEAYSLLKEIYLERGYRSKDIAALILTKNLFGLEIDERAAQLAGFALMMKARRDDREIFNKGIQPNVIVIRGMTNDLPNNRIIEGASELIELFKDAQTCGSLIRIPEETKKLLPNMKTALEEKKPTSDLWQSKYYDGLSNLIYQAELLSSKYDIIVANPPYMGRKKMNVILKDFAKTHYPRSKSDLFAMFIERGFESVKENIGYNAMVTMQSWMFLSSYEDFRREILKTSMIRNMVHMSNGVMGIAFGTNATVWINAAMEHYKGSYSYVDNSDLGGNNIPLKFPIQNDRLREASSFDFKRIPGSPIAYWVTNKVRDLFQNKKMIDYAKLFQGIITGDNEKHVRYWYECPINKITFSGHNIKDVDLSNKYWIPYNKGGESRRWYGNQDLVVNFKSGGRNFTRGKHQFSDYYLKPCFSWTYLSSTTLATRFFQNGFLWDVAGSSAFPYEEDNLYVFAALIGSSVGHYLLNIINPTINFQVENVAAIPLANLGNYRQYILPKVKECIDISKQDWDFSEISWKFSKEKLIANKRNSISVAYDDWREETRIICKRLNILEIELNKIFIEAYGLQNELIPDVTVEEITLFSNPNYRYKGDLTDNRLEISLKLDTMKELISYAVGCMMGRYSLDTQGFIYANSSNFGFDSLKYETFLADEDGIIPVTEQEWFDDDVACRFFEFIETVWAKKGLDENLDFIAGALGRKSGESSREAIRKYFVNDIYKDHCQTYKNRPIYWLFSSGKEKAFQALVYLHRYNEGTLARMRTEYVLPLQTKNMRYIEHLEKDKDAASGSAVNKIQKEIDVLQMKQAELSKFDEKLRHYADKRIKLDLEDGVKVNYVKFGDLLADVNKIVGSDKDESREYTE